MVVAASGSSFGSVFLIIVWLATTARCRGAIG
jgi:hypothetical protein